MITSVPLNPPWDQGDKNLAYTLTRSLTDIQFSVLTARNAPEPEGQNLYKLPLFHSRTPSLLEKARIYSWYLRKSFNNTQGQDVDLYHLTYQPFGLSSWMLSLLPEFHRVPTIHTVPATATAHQLSSSYLFADRVVALSEYGRQKLLSLGLKNVLHIPIGVDLTRWTLTPEQVTGSKKRLGLEGKKVLLFPGHHSEAYGIDVLLSAMPKISSVHPDAFYILACRMRSRQDWEKEQQVRRAVENLGLAHAVQFLQTIDDMQIIISASDVVLMPFLSMHDKIDIPTTLLEAMAAGKPSIISDIPPMNEVVCQGGCHRGKDRTGFLHRPGDAVDLANAVIQILDDDSLRLAMSENGTRLVRQRFDISMVARGYREQYLELIS